MGMQMFESLRSGKWGVTHLGLKHTFNPAMMHGKNALESDGNTAAFMMTPRAVFEEIGGFNESYEKCFEDVEYAVECTKRGYTHLTVVDAVCIHYEGATRGRGAKGITQNDTVRIATLLYDYYSSDGHNSVFAKGDKENGKIVNSMDPNPRVSGDDVSTI